MSLGLSIASLAAWCFCFHMVTQCAKLSEKRADLACQRADVLQAANTALASQLNAANAEMYRTRVALEQLAGVWHDDYGRRIVIGPDALMNVETDGGVH